jgi:hypothetical protein
MVVPCSSKDIRTRAPVPFHDFAIAWVRTVESPIMQPFTALSQSSPSCLGASVCAGNKSIQRHTDIKDHFSHRISFLLILDLGFIS